MTLPAQCWFCGKGIDTTDKEAVEVTVRNIWSDEADAARQNLFLHSICAAERLQGATMQFRLEVFTDPN